MMASFAAARTAILCVSAALSLSSFAQQTYPGKTIRLIVPFPPGGSIDPVARMAGSRQQEAAKSFIQFVTAPQARPLLHKGMMEPA